MRPRCVFCRGLLGQGIVWRAQISEYNVHFLVAGVGSLFSQAGRAATSFVWRPSAFSEQRGWFAFFSRSVPPQIDHDMTEQLFWSIGQPQPWPQSSPSRCGVVRLNRSRPDLTALHVAKQPFDDQPHEEEAQFRVLVIQAVHLFVGHMVQLAVGIAHHRQRADLIG